MAFKVECEKCGQTGKLVVRVSEKKHVNEELHFEDGDFTIRSGQYTGGIDLFELACNKCDNKIFLEE